VRLLDLPLHEFLPDLEELRFARRDGTADEHDLALLDAAEKLSEHNPMLGTRGVRLGVLLPELYRAQVRALTEATLQRLAADGDPRPQVMIPLTVTMAEFAHVAEDMRRTIAKTASGVPLHIPVGTMIETPRAALVAGELVTNAEFCSFGTNDLTQLTFGFSRDDIGTKLLPAYVEDGLLDHDPFAQLDQEGVGKLVADAVHAGARVAPHVHFGVCGEHGGDPKSIAYFHRIGLEYVSCSPFRVPVARLAAARVAIGADV
jgi:pyruvate,orthophosphate dikinase